jgi:hypothetical protein
VAGGVGLTQALMCHGQEIMVPGGSPLSLQGNGFVEPLNGLGVLAGAEQGSPQRVPVKVILVPAHHLFHQAYADREILDAVRTQAAGPDHGIGQVRVLRPTPALQHAGTCPAVLVLVAGGHAGECVRMGNCHVRAAQVLGCGQVGHGLVPLFQLGMGLAAPLP